MPPAQAIVQRAIQRIENEARKRGSRWGEELDGDLSHNPGWHGVTVARP